MVFQLLRNLVLLDLVEDTKRTSVCSKFCVSIPHRFGEENTIDPMLLDGSVEGSFEKTTKHLHLLRCDRVAG